WNTGSMARPTGEWMPPNTTTAFSRSITSRAAVTPFPGLPSSSRMTSSILRPPSTPPLALISSMATVSPRLIASPESAEPPDMAATSATITGGLVCCAGAVAIEQALLFVDSNRAKAVLVVQRHAAVVGRERGEYQLVKAVLAAQLDEARQQRAAHALAALTPLRVHGKIHHVAVGVARVEDVQTSPADDFGALVLRHDDRVARGL